MAKVSSIAKNNRRRRIVEAQAPKRAALKAIVYNKQSTQEARFDATIRLAKMRRDGAKVRVRNRCLITGRPRGYYRTFKLSRIALRDLASMGLAPGVIKASW